MTAKWTKKDLAFLRSALDTFVLVNRPLAPAFGVAPGERESFEVRAREAFAAHRQDIVLTHLREWRERESGRYRTACETIGNEVVRFAKPLDDENVQRFVVMAKEHDEAYRRAEALVLRVVREGLPPEVVDYDPFAKRG